MTDVFDLGSSLLIGVVSGIVSSIIIYILVFKIKPKLKISGKVAKSIENGKTMYRIKILNQTRFAIYNIIYSLHYCVEQADGIIKIDEIKPAKNPLVFISPNAKDDEKDKHAVRISYEIDENNYQLDDNSYLRFTIYATHGFTNTSTYIEVTYSKKDIVKGKFETGNSLKVLN